MNINQKTKAFTIVELLVVISIISILSGMIIVSLSNSRQKARDTRRKLDLDKISLTLENYYDNQSPNQYVISETEISINGTDDILTTTLTPNYMSKIPTDPLSTQSYRYQSFDNGLNYRLETNLENHDDPQGQADGDSWIFVVDND